MHTFPIKKHKRSNTDLVLRQARRLHRAAQSDSLSTSLPVLRRLIENQVVRDISLPELHRHRISVQRKHILRMLAIEAGHRHRADYRDHLEHSVESINDQQLYLRHSCGPNLWFSSFTEAENFSHQYGGVPLKVGKQAVIVQS